MLLVVWACASWENAMLFRRLFMCSLLAGLCAGLVYSAIQRFQVVPIIAAAEVFESDLEGGRAADDNPSGTATHQHQEPTWQPQDGAERTFWTVVTNVIGATGFALLLIPALGWWDRQRGSSAASIKSGLLWGAACWLCFFVWPAIGLRPELPRGCCGAACASSLVVVCGGLRGCGLCPADFGAGEVALARSALAGAALPRRCAAVGRPSLRALF